jgi:hypothetical protein
MNVLQTLKDTVLVKPACSRSQKAYSSRVLIIA